MNAWLCGRAVKCTPSIPITASAGTVSRSAAPIPCGQTQDFRRAPEQRRGGYPELMGHRAAIVIATAAPAPAPSQIGNGRSTPQSHDVENYQLQVRFKI